MRRVRAARRYVTLSVVLGLVQALCVIGIAISLADLGAQLLVHGTSPIARPTALIALAVSLFVRIAATFIQQRYAHRAATETIANLRVRLVKTAAELGPRVGTSRGTDVTALATKGLENLRPYLTGYLPQLLLAATVTPLCLVVVLVLDPTSFVLAIITLPLIPIFMILIGLLTEGRSARLLADMRTLWSQTLDLVEGLPTLVMLGRRRGPEKTVRDLSDRHRLSTIATLRYAFLSAMVLELLGTLCVALIAVGIGLRLVTADMELMPALAVLVLAPEIYLPLRQVGAQFHASTDGLAALDATFDVLDAPRSEPGTQAAPQLAHTTLRCEGLAVTARDGYAPDHLDAVIAPGQLTAIVGPSGAGKSTTIDALLGLLRPDSGRIVLQSADGELNLTDVDLPSYWNQITWVPQRAVLDVGTVREAVLAGTPLAENLRTTSSAVDVQPQLDAAAHRTGLDQVISQLPEGWDTPVGRLGTGLSLGQRQRVALTRALFTHTPLVILDEPTAHLDAGSERAILDLIEELRRHGRTVIIVAHRETLIDIADTVVHVHHRYVSDQNAQGPA
ncbi:thiol reductant ABC exporter subunit CydD [Devriesea agamarum]|uniref:thiol reductant ABC exporter subunit CydD n=1 Tax=Devriesea agamarum TaxID=472569 RepID=UPI00071C3974|nr:thiol reductant ABC exporter subunit CydD [Devriesea agamarum]